MIDDDTIKRLATQSGAMLATHATFASEQGYAMTQEEMRALCRAIWSLGRQAGLEEAAVTAWTQYMEACRKMHLPPSQWEAFLVAPAIRTLKENKHER